ncbi:hypothetical protein KAR91_69580 [Candidatus Pacearchaeota archaeon]|nr:hypothetical protein [Candidatus Pacearchaeota archaeon]
MNRKNSYSLDQLRAIFNTLPESALRRFAGIHIEDASTDTPRFTLVGKDEVAQMVEMKIPGLMSFESLGYSKIGNVALLSFSGEVPTELIRDLVKGINWSGLSVDPVTQHSSYGFFSVNERLDRTHCLVNLDTGYVAPISTIDGTYATKVEFIALENGSIELVALVDTKAVRTTLKLNELKEGYVPSWNPIKTDAEVHDLSMRIVDEKSSIVLATTDGIQMYRDGEIISFKSTKDLDVMVLDAGFAGMMDSFGTPVVTKGDDVIGSVIGFVTGDGELMTIPTNPTKKVKPTLVTDQLDTKVSRIIPDGVGYWCAFGNTIESISATPVNV